MFKLPVNKYIALVIILVILIVCYIGYNAKKSGKKTKSGKKSKTSKKTSKKTKNKKSKKAKDPDDDEDDDDDDSDNLRKDAEELYNLVHEPLCNNMQQEEFEEVVGDLADNFIYIELKQLYNQALQRRMDPSSSITIDDYVKVLKKESIGD